MIKEVKNIRLKTDSAYSSLLCYLNNRPGLFAGCGAGRRFMAIDAAGNFRPCSHTTLTQPGNNIMDYWYNSSHLAVSGVQKKTRLGLAKTVSICPVAGDARLPERRIVHSVHLSDNFYFQRIGGEPYSSRANGIVHITFIQSIIKYTGMNRKLTFFPWGKPDRK